MIRLERTNSKNPDFIALVKQLDDYLAVKDGEEHDFYDQFNKIENINHVVVLYENEKAVACGAIKVFDNDTMEIKRMFTCPEFRQKGYAAFVIQALEEWTQDLSYINCVLETGIRQEEAVHFYKKNGYVIIPNYGQYVGVANSLCFHKKLK